MKFYLENLVFRCYEARLWEELSVGPSVTSFNFPSHRAFSEQLIPCTWPCFSLNHCIDPAIVLLSLFPPGCTANCHCPWLSQLIDYIRCTVGWNCIKSTRLFYRYKPLSHELRSEWVSERANERISAAERSEQCEANDWAVRASERTNERSRAKRAVRNKRKGQYSTHRFYSHSTHCPMFR